MHKNFFKTIFFRKLLIWMLAAFPIYLGIRFLNLNVSPFLPMPVYFLHSYIFSIDITGIGSLREFILNLFFRIVPILVPIVIGTSSLMLNRYTSTYFNLIFEDKHIRQLVQFCLSYFVFHLILIFFKSPENTMSIEKLNNNFYFLLADMIFAIAILVYAICTSILIFLYSQPSKISSVILRKANNLAIILKKDLKKGISKEKIFNQNKIYLNRYIITFTNLLVLAVKSKDYEIIKDNIEKIGDITWNIIHELRNVHEDNFPKNRKDKVEFQSHIRKEANDLIKELEQLPPKFYIDIFENAFVNKEFYVCDEILNYFTKKGNDKKYTQYILKILPKLFKISLSYNYHGYSYDYCEKIVNSCGEIYKGEIRNSNSDIEYIVFLKLLKHSIYHKQVHVLNIVMKKLNYIIQISANKDEEIYKHVIYSGIYCLEIKSMTCFSYLLRALITSGFDIEKINSSYALIFSKKEENSTNEILNDASILFEDIMKDIVKYNNSSTLIFDPNIDKKYLYLKMYILFYSYYKLQLKISFDRIPDHCKEVSINLNFIENIVVNYNFIRTLLLDLEAHEKSWNILFIGQFETYLIDSVKEVFDINEKDLLKEELLLFSNSVYLKKLYKKIYWNTPKL